MSSTYTLKIAIDDSKIREIEKRLMNIVGGGQAGQAGGLGAKVTAASSGGNIGKNIAKLGLIATGVVGILMLVKKIADMTVSSSPMLMQMLKLINFGVMLILRPIGDFFGFFLRPLIIYFLRSIILPWYRIARPIMQKFGQWLGLAVTKNISSNLSGAWAIIIGDWEAVSKLTTQGNAQIAQYWADATTTVSKWFSSATTGLPLFTVIGDDISTWITEQGKLLPDFGTFIFDSIGKWIIFTTSKLPTFDSLVTNWNTWITDITRGLPTLEDIAAKISQIGVVLGNIGDAIKDFFIDLAAKLGIDISGLFSSKPTSTPASTTSGYDSSNVYSYIYPWTDTPTSNLSDETKSGRRF